MKKELNCKSCKYYVPTGDITIFRPYCLKDYKKFGMLSSLERCKKYEYMFNLNDEDIEYINYIVKTLNDAINEDRYEDMFSIATISSTKSTKYIKLESAQIKIVIEQSFKSKCISIQITICDYETLDTTIRNIYIDELSELEISQQLTDLIERIEYIEDEKNKARIKEELSKYLCNNEEKGCE